MPAVHCAAGKGGGDGGNAAAGAADDDDDNGGDDGSKRWSGLSNEDDEQRVITEALRAQVEEGKKTIDALQTAIKRLREEKDTEIALLSEQLAELQ